MAWDLLRSAPSGSPKPSPCAVVSAYTSPSPAILGNRRGALRGSGPFLMYAPGPLVRHVYIRNVRAGPGGLLGVRIFRRRSAARYRAPYVVQCAVWGSYSMYLVPVRDGMFPFQYLHRLWPGVAVFAF